MVQTADVRPFMRQHVRLLRPVEANRQIDARPQQAEHKRRGDAGRLIDAVFQAYGPCKAPPEPDQRDQSVQQHGQKTDKVQRRSDGNEICSGFALACGVPAGNRPLTALLNDEMPVWICGVSISPISSGIGSAVSGSGLVGISSVNGTSSRSSGSAQSA